jgi:hypothetical protein
LLQEEYEASFEDLLHNTEWDCYGHRSGNLKCRDCLVHSGFEASSVADAFSSARGMFAMLRASLLGPRLRPPGQEAPVPRAPSRPVTNGFTQGYQAPADLSAIRAAFEYRGNVTLTLDDGSSLEGYVTNLRADGLDLWRRGKTSTESVPLDRVRTVALTAPRGEVC